MLSIYLGPACLNVMQDQETVSMTLTMIIEEPTNHIGKECDIMVIYQHHHNMLFLQHNKHRRTSHLYPWIG